MGIKVIDLFAGCGGLGEGFASVRRGPNAAFEPVLSVEKEVPACDSLILRTFFRQFVEVPEDYYLYLKGEISKDDLFGRYQYEYISDTKAVLKLELNDDPEDARSLNNQIKNQIGKQKAWVLVGGPPCQAYSSSGRSRNKGSKTYIPENDHRHFLYRHFLDVVAKNAPPVFLMENVTGLLTAKVGGEPMFMRICNDLENPGKAVGSNSSDSNFNLGYRLFPLTQEASFDLFHKFEEKPSSYVVDASQYGVAQARNRVFLLGVRTDLKQGPKLLRKHDKKYSVYDFIGDLPKLRSGLSKQRDSKEGWLNAVGDILTATWFTDLGRLEREETRTYIKNIISGIRCPKADRGGRFVKNRSKPKALREWFYDPKLVGACNHDARSHMASDLHRYMFMAAETMRREDLHLKMGVQFSNVTLADFPEKLLPDHDNVTKNPDKAKIAFPDRFKVQRRFSPSSTVVSHLRSDGHYFIHYDPEQCRSLTVREAARLQSFPDNFFFEGSRSDAYQQIGNAVPPYLAQQIAVVIQDLLFRNNLIN